MNPRRAAVVAAFVVGAVALQTTLFGRLRPLDAAPALVVLVVIAVSRHLSAEGALATGFAAGLLQDLLSESPLGLWALTLVTVAFATVRLRPRIEDDVTLLIPLVLVGSFGALALFALLGTIFGEKTLADAGVVRKMILPAVYDLALAPLVLPLATRLLGRTPRRVGMFRELDL